ncbi:helix-turn-helix domain-containing protein [Novosphingobium hassiacum]|nr:helix-turn-helix transcriptional regulator [Novosphingobium hassiacum]
MVLRETFAKNLRLMRLAAGLTQEELAHRAGFDRNYVGNLERGKNSPTVDTLERLARELDIQPGAFFAYSR